MRFFSTSRTLLAETPAPTQLQESLARMRQSRTSRPPLAPRKAEQNRMTGFDAANMALMRDQRRSTRDLAKEQAKQEAQQQAQDRTDMERQMGRSFREGDVYAPHDLSPQEMAKWKKSKPVGKQSRDICDMLGINPLDHYKNFSIMSEYITEMGRIKGRSETGLRPINQRRMAKAIRRAVGCGLMPSVHRHPEILRASIEEPLMPRSGRRRGGM